MAPELLSIIFEVSPHPDHRVGEVKPWYGLAMRAIFLGAVRKYYSSITSAYLHEDNILHSYTTSSLNGFSKVNKSRKNPQGWIRITSCDFDTSRALLACVRKGRPLGVGAHLDLSGLHMRVDHWRIESQSSYPELMDDSYRKIGLEGRFEMTFESPTFFKDTVTNGYQYRLTPGLIFSSLHNKWNTVNATTEDKELLEYMKKNLFLRPVSVNAQSVSTGECSQWGSVGKVVISCEDREAAFWKTICGLATFARYSGVGKDTTIGFGQAHARRMD